MIRGAVRGAVLGGNVGKSRSPAIHRAAFRAIGMEGTYEAISIDAAGFRALVRNLRAEGYRYLNVTIPHKRAAAALATRRSALVRATGAANTLIFRRRGKTTTIQAENTDGYGLLTALRDLGVRRLAGHTVVMVGSGGAAAGALAAFVDAGARLRIVARRPAAARALRSRFSARQRARIEVLRWTPAALTKAVTGAKILISAVPADAWDNDDARAGLHALARDTAVLEMAYGATTPLARAVRGRVARYQDGLPMLVHQAARAVELALGKKPAADPLLRAARA